ncbi:MAG: ABC transporter substrate-binding protein [Bernardetiaceae bacterium]|nr:ABC transporter substrate-binding protein [Bernardetiaceae bacterium]
MKRLVLSLSIIMGLMLLFANSAQAQVRLYSGYSEGTYHSLGLDLSDIINSNRILIENDTIHGLDSFGEEAQSDTADADAVDDDFADFDNWYSAVVNRRKVTKVKSDTIDLGKLIILRTSHGSVANLNKLTENKSVVPSIAFMQYDVLTNSKEKSLQILAPLGYEAIHLITLQNSRIHSLKDLKGKNIGIGAADEGSHYTALRIQSECKIPWISFNYAFPDAIRALIEGKVDAIFFVGATPVTAFGYPYLKERLRIVPMAHKNLDKIYKNITIDSNTYSWVSEATPAYGVPLVLVSDENLKKEDAKEIITTLKNKHDILKEKGHLHWKDIKFSFQGINWNIYPGAKDWLGWKD